MRDFLRQFMLYSRSERRAVITLVILIVIVILVPRAYHFYAGRAQVVMIDTALNKEMSALPQRDFMDQREHAASGGMGIDSLHTGLFYFDPNQISTADWIKLGLTDRQAAVIQKYKDKGGKFRHPDDLRRIYVISDEMKDRLVPYVRIEDSYLRDKEKAEPFYSIEINTADSAAYEALYMIGPSLASRIVKYRTMLGGFCRIEQVGEAYGVSDSTFQIIKPHLRVNPALVTRIDLNSAEYETLRKHPYIHAKIAHAIINYRNMNGKFESPGELKKVKPVTDEIFQKLQPYLDAR